MELETPSIKSKVVYFFMHSKKTGKEAYDEADMLAEYLKANSKIQKQIINNDRIIAR